MGTVISVVVAYLIGAVPVGFLAGKLLKGIDVRDFGSGKMGATNVLRTLGPRVAAPVLLLDTGKGVAAVFIARALSGNPYAEALAAGAALAGHNWSVFIGFSGGRGVTAGLGAIIAMVPPLGAVAVGVGLLVIALTRYVSLGSLVGSATIPVGMLVAASTGHTPWAYFVFVAPGVALIFFQHRDNLGRLARGTERKLGQKAEARQSAAGVGSHSP